jgi:hypothetical protein
MNQPVAVAKLAVEGLKAKYEAANGVRPALVKGGGNSVGGDAFRSAAEQVAAMRDPRYGKDPAYTRDVEAKSMRSNF